MNFVQGNDNVLEENDVLVTKRNRETGNYAGENIKELSSTIEFVGFVDQTEEAFVDCLSNHLSTGNQLKYCQLSAEYLPWRTTCEEYSSGSHVQLILQSRRVPKSLEQIEGSRTLLSFGLRLTHE